jgi:demethoxyubiquinone hydroxylase (CLK1/Coq7/Cat5 family)
VKRIERRIFQLNDQLTSLASEQAAVEAELSALRLIDEDAQRDAAIGYDRLEATSTRGDVRRFERALEAIARRRSDLADRRQRLIDRLINPSG